MKPQHSAFFLQFRNASLFKFQWIAFAMLLTSALIAQNGVGINLSGTAADPSSIFDVSSTTKGVLFPRMTNAQKLAIPSPANGLTIYQTDGAKGYWVFNGTAWSQIGFFGNGSSAGNTPYWDGTSWIVNNSNIFNAGANVGIGITSPTAKLHVSGNPVTKTSADSITEGILRMSRPSGNGKNGSLVEFSLGSFNYNSSNSNSKLNINLAQSSMAVAPATVMTMTSAGNIGIGNVNPHAPLQFANTSDQRKLVLYETADNDHQFIGFGNDADGLKFQIDSATSSHRFYSGTNASSSAELMRIKGDGKVGIGTNNPLNRLDVKGGLMVGNSWVGARTVPSDGAMIQGNVKIGADSLATASIDPKLEIRGNSSGYLVTVKNTNSGTGSTAGDGIKISLGRNHPLWNGSAYKTSNLGGLNTVITSLNSATSSIRNWILHPASYTSLDPQSFINLLSAAGNLTAGTACNITNTILDQLIDKLPLPLKVGPISVPNIVITEGIPLFGGFYFDVPLTSNDINIPGFGVPKLEIPSQTIFNEITLIPQITKINCSAFPTLSAPTMDLTNVSNTMSSNNYYLQFTDKDDRQLGGVRSQSIDEWEADYLTLPFYLELIAGIDLMNLSGTLMTGLKSFYEIGQAFNAIGVEYISGNGDYAEWLERKNPHEFITEGDIVGVSSGKISKDLTAAEQIMAVSHRPIVLGNMPQKGKEHLGNNIAFMGQIPVKITGPVSGGDYIVANGMKGGYGKAIHPADMNLDDYKWVVGRSWETNPNPGPKMINTVVGLHNHNFLNIVKGMKEKMEKTDDRLSLIEATLQIKLSSTLASTKK